MKTQKHMYESTIQRVVWLEVKEKLIVWSILLMLVILGIWKYEIYTTSVLSASKWLLISIGFGFCWGSVVSYMISPEWILQSKRGRNHQKTQNCWTKMKAFQKLVEEDPNNKQAKIRLVKVEYRLEKLGIISSLLNNPYKIP